MTAFLNEKNKFFLHMKRNIKWNGLWWALHHYYIRIKAAIFTKLVFGRTDIKVFPDARLGGLGKVKIGSGFSAGHGLWLEAIINFPETKQEFEPELVIGDRVGIGEYVHIGCNYRIVIGNDVLMGSKIYITDHNHGVYRGSNADSPLIPPAKRKLTEGESVIIGDRCWIGEFVTILPGVTIGEGSIIGSHSTVTHDIPANSIAVGSPAKVVKQWNDQIKEWVHV